MYSAQQQQPIRYLNSQSSFPGPAYRPAPAQMETYHELNKKQTLQLRKLVDARERIFYCGVLKKINKHLIPQSRILVITDKALYNIKPDNDIFTSIAFAISPTAAIKRKIDINKVFAVTLSASPASNQEQFIIHIRGEYDYRYSGGQKREKIIKSLLNVYFTNYRVPFIMYFREEEDLASYHTTDDDFKAKIDKRPKEGRLFVTPDMIARGLGWIISNRRALIDQSNMFSSVPTMSHPTMNTNQMPLSTGMLNVHGPGSPNQGLAPVNGLPNMIQPTTNGVFIHPNHPQMQNTNPNPNQIYYPPNSQSFHGNLPPQNNNVGPISPPNNIGTTINSQNQAYVAPPSTQNYSKPNNQEINFIPNEFVSPNASSNVNVNINFEKMLQNPQKGQNGPYFK